MDYKYYLIKDVWTIKEASVLLAGFDPEKLVNDVEIEKMTTLLKSAQTAGTLKNPIILFRGYTSNDCGYAPIDFIAWAVKKELDIPEWANNFFERKKEAPSNSERNSQELSELSEKEHNSLLKIIYGMALEKYKYSPKDPRSTVTGTNKGSIHRDLASHGINMDVATIRNYLKEAAEKNS